MKAEIPADIPASMVSARAGLAIISSKMLLPVGIDLYSEFVNDAPMTNRIGMEMMSPSDHLPNMVFGEILQDRFVIVSSFPDKKPSTPLILHPCHLCPATFL